MTDPGAKWLQLAHGLKAIGIPFVITRDYKRALRHNVIFVYPELSSKVLPPSALKMLADVPHKGGTLIAQGVDDNFKTIFGFQESLEITQNTELHINPHSSITNDFVAPEEQLIKIGTKAVKNLPTVLYLNPSSVPIATYAANAPAIIQKNYPRAGNAYAFGVDIGQLIALSYSGAFAWSDRQPTVSQYSSNHYQPTLDVLLRLLKQIYINGQKHAVTLATVPGGKSLAVILSHDIDYNMDAENSLVYAEFEKQHAINATYFIQTKYITDWNDKAFFTLENLPKFKQLRDMGMEIAGNTVAASLQFNIFPPGSGEEKYPDYIPYVVSESKTLNASILGELRVNYFLLQHFSLGQNIVSFRGSGFKSPKILPQALAATGFHYDSSVTANDVLTHLPFQLDYNWVSNVEVPVYEFPMAIEDRQDTLLVNDPNSAIELTKKLSGDGGLVVALIEPNVSGKRFEFEKNFVNLLQHTWGQSVWYGTLEDFGNWWVARDQVKIAVSNTANKKTQSTTVLIDAPIAISELTLIVSPGMRYVANDRQGIIVTQQEEKVIIQHLVGRVELLFK